MKKKLFSVVVAVAMMVSCVCEASAVFVDKSVTNGEGKIDNVLTYEELLRRMKIPHLFPVPQLTETVKSSMLLLLTLI